MTPQSYNPSRPPLNLRGGEGGVTFAELLESGPVVCDGCAGRFRCEEWAEGAPVVMCSVYSPSQSFPRRRESRGQ